MKDPDDGTFMPQPGTYPINSNDTLILGSILDSGFVFMYPSEYPNAPPWLVVYHHLVGIAETKISAVELSLQVCPNPFHKKTVIKWQRPDDRWQITDNKLQMKIFDAAGQLVRQFDAKTMRLSNYVVWHGTDHADRLVPAGVYFCKIEAEGRSLFKKICLVR